MDSMSSSYTANIKAASGSYMSNMNESQSSFASSSREGSEEDSRNNTTPRSTGPASAKASPGQPRQSGSSSTVPPGNASTHISGLMCNMHRTTGREPHARVGATTTILGDKLYVFGGRALSRSSPVLTNDLYELDLIRRHWIKVEAHGQIPAPRYFHSVCPLGDTKLVCYGGMSPAEPVAGQPEIPQGGPDAQPEVVVMSDIHIFDALNRTWTFVATQDTPQGRYAHCATILPSAATFSSSVAPLSALHHNPPSSNANQGTLGVNIDGTGGAEMIVVGGQDSANHYIEQISVFNLRSLKWVSTEQLGKSCGAYRSVVAPIPNTIASRIGKTSPIRVEGNPGISQESKEPGSSMLIYSNYNFLDVKLELQVRAADGTLSEKPMNGTYSPPGLRFPSGGVIDTNFVVSGTYLTSSKQEYALWAMDLRSLTWSRIDAGGAIFSHGSWNRGVLWHRRNTFVILGNRRRSLVEDYNHRRLNFSHVCMVELEAFGLYDNPRKTAPMSGFVSASSPLSVPSIGLLPNAKLGHWCAGGRTLSKAAEELGASALGLRELADMDILAVGGERIPVNSRIVARRWGPYFIQLLREGTATQDGNDAATLRPSNQSVLNHNPSRFSSVTITPSFDIGLKNLSRSTTLINDEQASSFGSTHSSSTMESASDNHQNAPQNSQSLLEPPDPSSLLPRSRPRTLYLPHTYLTLQSLLYFLYTSSLPPPSSNLSTPQILCSLLQLARPYRVEGLVEAVVERLHGVLDSRNAAAVFNAAAMAAGGGRGIAGNPSTNLAGLEFGGDGTRGGDLVERTREALRINTSFGSLGSAAYGRSTSSEVDEDEEPGSAVSSATSSMAGESETSSRGAGGGGDGRDGRLDDGQIWDGDISCVIGLQKRGLRGLMDGRRLRERGASVGVQGPGGRVGLGIA
ncbi:MAG: hypothetical protein M1818_007445 [Claussenomyces sp. TS43310]|nr:MAG: hypothetical protein M1818_007445 [Claussenomyces sp. TS43310]